MLPKLLAPQASDELRAEIRRMIEANDRAGIASALRSMAARPDSTATIAAAEVPVLVVSGEQDVLSPPDVMAPIAATARQATMATLPGAGHLSAWETPDAFAAAVAAWLTGLPSA